MSRKKKFRFNLIVLIVLIILLLESLIANIINRTYAASIPQKYDLRSEIPIVVKNQYQNEACVYMSRSTSLETHVKLGQKNGKYSFFKETPVFSVLTSKKAGQYVSVSIDRTEKVLKEIYNDNNKTEDEILKIQGEYTSEKIKKALEKLQPSFDTTVDGKRSSSNLVTYKVLPSIIDGTNKRIKQNEEEVTYAYNITREEEKVDFNLSTKDVYNKIRGLYPWPIGYTSLDGKKVKLHLSRVGTSKKEGSIGEIINIYNDALGVKTLDGEILLTMIQFEGKNKILVKDYLNGVHDKESLLGKKFI